MAKNECKKNRDNNREQKKVKNRYTCSRCGLGAAREKHLCRPEKK